MQRPSRRAVEKDWGFLRQHRFIQDFYLAGGTALALQIGHRISTDLDWFSRTQTFKRQNGIKFGNY